MSDQYIIHTPIIVIDIDSLSSLSIDDKCNQCQKEFIQHGEVSYVVYIMLLPWLRSVTM